MSQTLVFDQSECQVSLVNQDLELGGAHRQREENYEHFLLDRSMLEMVQGSLLEPFAQCLSECSFIEREKNSHYGSRCASNVFDKGYIEGSRQNHSCYSNQGGAQNISLNLQTQTLHHKVNNSGFGYAGLPRPNMILPTEADLQRLD